MRSLVYFATRLLISCLLATSLQASLGIGVSQLDSLSHDTNITLDYETPNHHFETGIGLAFDTVSATQGSLGNEHETYLTSYLGIVRPLYQHVRSDFGTRVTWHLTDDVAEHSMQESKLDIGLYTGLKYALTSHITFFTRIEPVSYHPHDSHINSSQPDTFRYFREAMTGLIFYL